MSLLGSLLKKTNASQATSLERPTVAKPTTSHDILLSSSPATSRAIAACGAKRRLVGSTGGDGSTAAAFAASASSSPEAEAKSVKKTKLQPNSAQAAYMGPNLWDEVLTFDECSSMELLSTDEFLFQTGLLPDSDFLKTMEGKKPRVDSTLLSSSSSSSAKTSEFDSGSDAANEDRKNDFDFNPDEDLLLKLLQGCSLPSKTLNPAELLVGERIDSDGKVERHPSTHPTSPSPSQFASVDLPITSQELHLATAPGEEVFNPKQRRFETDELKPMPVLRKAKKQFVPEEQKDEKYWERRRKNNVAAKRARDAQRIKINQIMIRTSWLEKENEKMQEMLEAVKAERDAFKSRLARYEDV